MAGMLGKHHSEATKTKIRNMKLGSRNYNFGKNLSEEIKAKLRANRGESHGNWKGNNAKPEAGRKRAENSILAPKECNAITSTEIH